MFPSQFLTIDGIPGNISGGKLFIGSLGSSVECYCCDSTVRSKQRRPAFFGNIVQSMRSPFLSRNK